MLIFSKNVRLAFRRSFLALNHVFLELKCSFLAFSSYFREKQNISSFDSTKTNKNIAS